MLLDIIKKITGPSIWTSIAGFLAMIITYVYAGGDLIENIIAFLDSNPETVFDKEVFAEALHTVGLGSVLGVFGFKSKDNDVSTEEVIAHKNG